MAQSALQTIKDYHQQSKHKPGAYARSAGYMDWANQPLPYRLYADTEKLYLPFNQAGNNAPAEHLFEKSADLAKDICLHSVASFLQNSLGLSAWKSYNGTEWALRINPSSGNLHPTECYLLLPDLQHADKKSINSVHYNPYLNCLEKRALLTDSRADFLQQTKGFAIVLTSIAWREAWKYGERAYRYCQHDLGHALAALSVAANFNGWDITLLEGLSNTKIDALLGLNQSPHSSQEREYVDCVCWVSTASTDLQKVRQWIAELTDFTYPQQSNQLSQSHQSWPVIDRVFEASHRQPFSFITETPLADRFTDKTPILPDKLLLQQTAQSLVLQRRSAQSFDRSKSMMSSELFLQQLQKTLPTQSIAFSVLPQPAQVHLLLFVHNVQNMAPGLYLWVRNGKHLRNLQAAFSEHFQWQQYLPEQPLYLLQKGDYRRVAKAVSCEQDIAADSAYSVGMLTRFEETLSYSASHYPILFWETGIIGQVLYLVAESHALRGTGIGCFFDDLVHELLGLKDQQWQSLYHFTIGKQIDDARILTKPAYFHLQG